MYSSVFLSNYVASVFIVVVMKEGECESMYSCERVCVGACEHTMHVSCIFVVWSMFMLIVNIAAVY